MSNVIISPKSSATPAAATLAPILDDITTYIGGQTSPHSLNRARMALKQAIREFNTWAWRFNRVQQTIPWVANTSEYALNSDARNTMRATLLNNASVAIEPLEYRPYEAFSREFAMRLGTSSYPTHYTIRNIHKQGKVMIYPPMGPTPSATYPSAQFDYHTRIAVPASDSDSLDVPVEVEEAIRQTAIAIAISAVRSFEEAKGARDLADRLRFALESDWRDYPDSRTMA